MKKILNCTILFVFIVSPAYALHIEYALLGGVTNPFANINNNSNKVSIDIERNGWGVGFVSLAPKETATGELSTTNTWQDSWQGWYNGSLPVYSFKIVADAGDSQTDEVEVRVKGRVTAAANITGGPFAPALFGGASATTNLGISFNGNYSGITAQASEYFSEYEDWLSPPTNYGYDSNVINEYMRISPDELFYLIPELSADTVSVSNLDGGPSFNSWDAYDAFVTQNGRSSQFDLWDFQNIQIDVELNPVPEPTTAMLLCSGLFALGLFKQYQKK